MAGAYVHKQALTPQIAAEYAHIYWTPGVRRALVELSRSYDSERAALIPDAGHLSQEEQPAAFLDVVLGWLG